MARAPNRWSPTLAGYQRLPFPGGVGKTWSPEDFNSLIHDVTTKVFDRLPDETWFYPGHGDDSTLGAERPHLAEWRERGW